MSKQDKLSDQRWELLVERIERQEFVPFIGAEECSNGVPTSSEIARDWASRYRYPLRDGDEDLARVAQFIVIDASDEHCAHKRLASRLKAIKLDSSLADEPHGLLARLPLAIYVTTNYHSLLTQALRAAKRDVHEGWCRWNIDKARNRSEQSNSSYAPTVASPYVFHLFGSVEYPDALVLTEDNYLDFLIRISEDRELIPSWIQEAVASYSLLFIGYHPRDFEFRVLLRCLRRQLELYQHFRLSVSIDVVTRSTAKPEMEQALRAYLDRYCQSLKIHVHWESPRAFLRQLHDRCVQKGLVLW